jgi:type I restriction enzyme S subunit
MYLTCALMFSGHAVTCPKPGPDVGITYKGRHIWFEATSPSPGKPGSPDYAGGPVEGPVPEEKIILRYLNSISTKHNEQYLNWLKKGIVSEKDAFVIAINPWAIPWDHRDGDPPRVLQAGYTIGTPYGEAERETLKPIGIGYHSRHKIMKGPEAYVDTGVFQREEYKNLSALLCSRAEATNRPNEMGGDFQLAPNPNATVPLPKGFRLRGIYYDPKKTEKGHEVTPR